MPPSVLALVTYICKTFSQSRSELDLTFTTMPQTRIRTERWLILQAVEWETMSNVSVCKILIQTVVWHAFLKTEYWHIFAAQRIFLCAKVFAKWVGCRPKLSHFPAAQCTAVCRVYCWRGFVTFGESGFLSWSLVMYCNYCKYLLLVFVV